VALSDITPVVLTFDEEENIDRTLESLREFRRVVMVDSGSADGTERIVGTFPNVSWFVRRWTGFADQWGFAIGKTDIQTAFVLALDADMAATPELVRELADVVQSGVVDGGVISFEYRIRGIPLAGSLYPPQLRLLRTKKARAGQRGHAHVLELEGEGRVVRLRSRLIHDDRKGLEAFVRAQLGYSAQEVLRVFADVGSSGVKSLFRRSFPFTPHVVWMLAWLRAGGPFRGPAARRYSLERLIYEAMLRWRIENRLLDEQSQAHSRKETSGP
jgi:glycosyltransferase involved in cell wall biosynthesis